jgi:hypothetical protein
MKKLFGKKLFGNDRGQIAFLYAGVLVVLIGAICLCADVAVMYLNWQDVQKTADAAALAGANYLDGYVFTGTAAAGCGGQSDDAMKVACTYAVNNGLAASNLTLTEPTASSLQVVAKKSGLPYFFGKVLGLNTYAVAATAVAQASGPVNTVTKGLFPLGLQCTAPCDLANLDPGQPATFGTKFVGGLAPGNWNWLGFGGTGASTLGSNLQNGATGSYTIGDSVSTAPGNKGNAGPVKQGLDARLATCPTLATDPCSNAGNPKDIPAGDQCLVVVPVVDYKGCTGNCTMAIEGFAYVYLEPTSTSKMINGCFVNLPAPSTISSSGAPSLGPIQPPTLIQ